MWAPNFESEEFWNKFHKEESSFEWYGDNKDLESLIDFSLSKEFQDSCRSIVNVGCGTAATPQILADLFPKATEIDNVDYSDVALGLMREKYKSLPASVKWSRIDISKGYMREYYGNNSVDLIIDKGFMDSYLSRPNESEETIKILADEYLSSCIDILKKDGKFVVITLAEPRIVKAMSKYFFKRKDLKYNIVPFTLRKNQNKYQMGNSNGYIPEPYCIIVSPLYEDSDPVYKVSELPGDVVTQLLGSFEKKGQTFLPFIRLTKSLPKMRFLHYISITWTPGVRRSIEYASKTGKNYEIGIYDSTKGKPPSSTRSLKTGAVIIPNGCEYDWTFVGEKGNEILAQQLKVSRLLTIISFSGEPDHADIEGFLPSLSPTANHIAIAVVPPAASDHSDLILYQKDGLIAKESGNHKTRTLIFASFPQLVQSEVAILDGHFDFLDLQSAYYKLIIISGIIPTLLHSNKNKIGIIGTGAGCLDMAIIHLIDFVRMTDESTDCFVESVEIDERIVEIGKNYFGLSDDENHHRISIQDGTEWIAEQPDASLNVLIIDAGGNDVTDPVRLPAAPLRNIEFLKIVQQKLTQDGSLIVNFVSRDSSCISDFVKDLQSTGYKSIYSLSDTDEINQVIVARKSTNISISIDSIDRDLKSFETNFDQLPPPIKNLTEVSIHNWN